MKLRRIALYVPCLLLAVAVLRPAFAGGEPSQQDNDALVRKVLQILQYGNGPSGPRQTTITEAELNSFLQLSMTRRLPSGVSDPRVSMLGNDAVKAFALVDLDEVAKASTRPGSDALQLLSGRVPVEVQGVLKAHDGFARFDVQSATVSGLPLPSWLLKQMVAYYSRSPEFPSGVDLDAPFALPSRIREIRVTEREAVVVQR